MSRLYDFTPNHIHAGAPADVEDRADAVKTAKTKEIKTWENEYSGFIRKLYNPIYYKPNQITSSNSDYMYDKKFENKNETMTGDTCNRDSRPLCEDMMPLSPYKVYKPKQSKEYYKVLNERRIRHFRYNLDGEGKDADLKAKFPRAIAAYVVCERDRNMSNNVMDDYRFYENSQHKPVSPHLYGDSSGLRSTDTRIVGTNFVMLSMRKPDAWFDKVDKLLAQAKKY